MADILQDIKITIKDERKKPIVPVLLIIRLLDLYKDNHGVLVEFKEIYNALNNIYKKSLSKAKLPNPQLQIRKEELVEELLSTIDLLIDYMRIDPNFSKFLVSFNEKKNYYDLMEKVRSVEYSFSNIIEINKDVIKLKELIENKFQDSKRKNKYAELLAFCELNYDEMLKKSCEGLKGLKRDEQESLFDIQMSRIIATIDCGNFEVIQATSDDEEDELQSINSILMTVRKFANESIEISIESKKRLNEIIKEIFRVLNLT